MNRKILAMATALASWTGIAQAETPVNDATSQQTANITAEAPRHFHPKDFESFTANHPAPTMVRLSVWASTPVEPDRFRSTVIFDEYGKNTVEIEKRAETTLAKIQKVVTGVQGVKATPGAHGTLQESRTQCASDGGCAQRASVPHVHAELELVADSQQALDKALTVARKATARESALAATPIYVERSDAMIEKARIRAMLEARRMLEESAAALTKENGHWHIHSIDFSEPIADFEPMVIPLTGMCGAMPQGKPTPQNDRTARPSQEASMDLRANATILLFAPPPKP